MFMRDLKQLSKLPPDELTDFEFYAVRILNNYYNLKTGEWGIDGPHGFENIDFHITRKLYGGTKQIHQL